MAMAKTCEYGKEWDIKFCSFEGQEAAELVKHVLMYRRIRMLFYSAEPCFVFGVLGVAFSACFFRRVLAAPLVPWPNFGSTADTPFLWAMDMNWYN